MPRGRMLSLPFVLTLVLLGLAPLGARGQEGSPVAEAPSTSTVIASGLTNPRGFVWGPDGTLYVALAGSGGSDPATEEAPTTQAIGPWQGGDTAAVVRIENSCPVAVATGLPSGRDAMGGVLGAEDLAFLGGELYAAVDGGGPVHGNPDQPSGIYRIGMDGTATLVADFSAWVRANPVANVPPDYDPDAGAYRMVGNDIDGLLWVIEPNSGQVVTVTPDGTITRVADLSAGHPVPAAIAPAPAGGVYVGTLTTVPFPDGAAKVIQVSADGTVADVWTGLTVVTGLAVGPADELYALEMSTGNTAEPPFLTFGTGKVVRQTGPDTSEDVATGLMLPIHLAVGPDGAFYVSSPAIGGDGGEGVIMRLNVAGMGEDMGIGMGTPCEPVAGTTPPPATPVASPTA